MWFTFGHPYWLCDALEKLHTASGLPWWGTIMTATVGVRLLLLPVTVYSIRNSYYMQAAVKNLGLTPENRARSVMLVFF